MSTMDRAGSLILFVLLAFMAYSLHNLSDIAVAVHLKQNLTYSMVAQIFGAVVAFLLLCVASLCALFASVKS